MTGAFPLVGDWQFARSTIVVDRSLTNARRALESAQSTFARRNLPRGHCDHPSTRAVMVLHAFVEVDESERARSRLGRDQQALPQPRQPAPQRRGRAPCGRLAPTLRLPAAARGEALG